MKRENSKLRNKRRDRRCLERAIVRAMRGAWLGGQDPAKLEPTTVITLIGLERARRSL
jgi:hypothetical protein